MLPQPVKVSDITDEQSAQAFFDQSIMTTFCRVLDTSRMPPDVVMTLLAKVKVAANTKWNIAEATLIKYISGKHTIYIISAGKAPVEIDWITFE